MRGYQSGTGIRRTLAELGTILLGLFVVGFIVIAVNLGWASTIGLITKILS